MSNETSDQELERIYRQQTQGAPPGGRSSRGPAVHATGSPEPQGPVPPYEGRKEQADSLDNPKPRAGETDVKGAGGIRQTTEPAPDPRPDAGSREEQLNQDTNTDASAEEIAQRISRAGTAQGR